MMRKYISVITLSASAALCLGVNAAQAETLYVGGGGGSIEQIFKEKIIPSFEAKTGAKVVYVPGNSTDTLAKIQAQKGNQQMSFVMFDHLPMYQAASQGLCSKLDDSEIYHKLYSKALTKDGSFVGIGFLATGLGYNTEVFAKNGWSAPTSWMDLVDGKYKQSIAIPPITNGYGLATLLMMAKLNGGSENKIEPGFDVMVNKVSPNVVSWEPSPGKMAEMLQTGEAAMVVWGNSRVQAVKNQGAPVEFVYPKEGAFAIINSGCVVEGGPSPKLGQQFLRHILSAESQLALASGEGWGPVNKDVKLPEDVAKRVIYGADQVDALLSTDAELVNTKRAEWTTRWNRSVEH
ncbi:ABC transporter substrate-binding protein [Pseudomonas sp. GM49]|uniref:ABC transporter substrate-binding protein n=1 Tax=unclassified Pseudomonas TaxID=196821 RepID=UPI0002702802|nr:ABC transporter substrate-binding protein [Pseudomonas sp. GM49]EJM53594.1 spermidine/putrescine-binding periplasmic protein [Pseudomonas sp. GM49]